MNTKYLTIELTSFTSMCDNDPTMIAETLAVCLAECKKLIGILMNYGIENDLSVIARHAHKLKPTMHYLGAPLVYSKLESLEHLTTEDNVSMQISETSALIFNVIADLRHAVDQFAPFRASA